MAAEAFPVTSILWKRPVDDGPVPADNFIQSSGGSISAEQLKDGEVLVQLLYLSVDPYMRGRMREMKHKYFVGPFEAGQPLTGGGLGLVKASKAAALKEGAVVSGFVPWSTYFIADAAAQDRLQVVDPGLLGKVPLSYFLGTLGMPGMTAYASIKKIAEPKQGGVAFVSGAAGAVGLVAGQLLKHVYACKVIGSAGSDDKVALLKELGFDAAFNYKTQDTAAALAHSAPDGIDIYFDNVGGKALEDSLEACKNFARIVACGAISQYDASEEARYGIKNLFYIVSKRIKMQGFIVSDYAAELGAEFAANMAQYVLEGKVAVHEHVTEGIENAGRAFGEMMRGANTGKAVVKVVAEDPFPVNKQ